MPQALSKDLRERAVKAYNDGVGTIPEVAKLFSIGIRTLSRYIANYKRTGDLTPGKSTGRPPFLTKERLDIIKGIVLSSPDDRLEDYCLTFKQITGEAIKQTTLWNACDILNINRKKKVFLQQSRKELMCRKKEKIL